MYFVIGDYLAGMVIGVLTALGVRAAVWPGMDMVVAMLLGMAIGMVIHLSGSFVGDAAWGRGFRLTARPLCLI